MTIDHIKAPTTFGADTLRSVGSPPNPAGGDQANSVFQMGLRADIGEEVAQTSFAHAINVQLKRAAEPGDANNLASRTHRFDGLVHRLMPGHSLLGTTAGAFKDDVSTNAACDFFDGFDHIALGGIQDVVCSQLSGDAA